MGGVFSWNGKGFGQDRLGLKGLWDVLVEVTGFRVGT